MPLPVRERPSITSILVVHYIACAGISGFRLTVIMPLPVREQSLEFSISVVYEFTRGATSGFRVSQSCSCQ
jgi:hypothetical protein